MRQNKKRSTTTRKGVTIMGAKEKADATLEEFETRDLGEDIAKSGVAVVVRPQQPTSILLPLELKEQLRERGKQLGVGYQTVAKMILAKYVGAKL